MVIFSKGQRPKGKCYFSLNDKIIYSRKKALHGNTVKYATLKTMSRLHFLFVFLLHYIHTLFYTFISQSSFCSLTDSIVPWLHMDRMSTTANSSRWVGSTSRFLSGFSRKHCAKETRNISVVRLKVPRDRDDVLAREGGEIWIICLFAFWIKAS